MTAEKAYFEPSNSKHQLPAKKLFTYPYKYTKKGKDCQPDNLTEIRG